jgi:hypothetical protein
MHSCIWSTQREEIACESWAYMEYLSEFYKSKQKGKLSLCLTN